MAVLAKVGAVRIGAVRSFNGVIVLVVSVVVTPYSDMNGEAALRNGHFRSHAPAVITHQVDIVHQKGLGLSGEHLWTFTSSSISHA